jgi:hypothetical protein
MIWKIYGVNRGNKRDANRIEFRYIRHHVIHLISRETSDTKATRVEAQGSLPLDAMGVRIQPDGGEGNHERKVEEPLRLTDRERESCPSTQRLISHYQDCLSLQQSASSSHSLSEEEEPRLLRPQGRIACTR